LALERRGSTGARKKSLERTEKDFFRWSCHGYGGGSLGFHLWRREDMVKEPARCSGGTIGVADQYPSSNQTLRCNNASVGIFYEWWIIERKGKIEH